MNDSRPLPRRPFDSLVAPVVRLLGTVRSMPKLRRRTWRLEGKEASSGAPLSVLCSAGGQTRRYLTQLLFGESGREIDLGQLWLWQLCGAGWARKHGCSLVLVQVDPFLRRFLERGDWFFIPLWLGGTTSLPITSEILASDSVRSDLNAIGKAGLGARVTRDAERFEDFYHHMYVPHVTAAHGASVYVNPYDTMKARLADSDLVLVHDGERDIAGMMIVYDDSGPRLWSMGVREGDRRYLKQGALAALYHFSLEHLAAKGFHSVSLGLSRAFLNDGVLRYKRKWAQRLTDTTAPKIALRAATDTPASDAFLHNNPFIFETEGKLYGALFLREEDPVTTGTAKRLKRRYFHDGLAKLVLFHPRPSATPQGLEMPADVTLEPWDRRLR